MACMYDGFKILKWQIDDSLDVVVQYNEHESIAYGVDWCMNEVMTNECIIAGKCQGKCLRFLSLYMARQNWNQIFLS